MPRSRLLLAGMFLWALVPRLHAQEPPSAPIQARPIVRDVHVVGSKELAEREAIDAAHVRVGEPLPEAPERLARAIERRYQDEGYSFARAKAGFDETR